MIDPQLTGGFPQIFAVLKQFYSLPVKLCIVPVPLHDRRIFLAAGHAAIALAACFRQACFVLPDAVMTFRADFRFHALIIGNYALDKVTV